MGREADRNRSVEGPRSGAREGLTVRADLDPPGETSRQTRVFLVWVACLALAVAVGISTRARVSSLEPLTPRVEAELARSRSARLKIAIVLGIALPALLTWLVTRHHRRGGAHARGIVVDVTGDGELRVWGRGYGTRVSLAGAAASERLVDVYAGRLGAWRQRRLRVKHGDLKRAGGREIQLATRATEGDASDGLGVEGGEGDCVELARKDYESIRAEVLRQAPGFKPGGQS